MANNLASNARPNFSEADPEDEGFSWQDFVPGFAVKRRLRTAQRRLVDIRAARERLDRGEGTAQDRLMLVTSLPDRMAAGVVPAIQNIPNALVSGATVLGDVSTGKYNPVPVAEGEDPNANIYGQALKEAELPGRAMDLAGLTSSATLAVPAERAVQLGSGAMRSVGEKVMEGDRAALVKGKVYTDRESHARALELAAKDNGYESAIKAAEAEPSVYDSLDDNNFGRINKNGEFKPQGRFQSDANPKESAAPGTAVLSRDAPQWGQAAFKFRDNLYTDDFHAGAIDKFLVANGYKKAAEGGLDEAVRDMPDLQDVADESLGGIGKDGKFIPFTSDEITKTPRRTGGFFANKSPEAGALILAASQTKEPFYSATINALADMKPTKASGEQWLATLKNKGVKGEELETLEAALKGQKALTNEQVGQIAAKNKPQLEEHWKGTDRKYYDDDPEYLVENDNTKFFEYQLPGGENYRELVMMLPQKRKVVSDAEAEAKVQEIVSRAGFRSIDDVSPALRQQYLDAAKTSSFEPSYSSSHWDEPNVLAHVRMNDRELPMTDQKLILAKDQGSLDRLTEHYVRKGNTPEEAEQLAKEWIEKYHEAPKAKTLFLEELQSDWHQTGRKQGYKGAERSNSAEALEEQLRQRGYQFGAGRQLYKLDGTHVSQTDVPTDVWEKFQDVLRASSQDYNANTRVPDAPFKKSWPELLLKRMVREASEKGYDQIAWTDGATQAERYDLSKHIDALDFDKKPLVATDDPETWTRPTPDTEVVVRPWKDGKKLDTITSTWAKLPDLIGKEMAEKIRKHEGEKGTFRGLDLKVGGEGMRGFYDEMLPRMANKLFGKWGGKVKVSHLRDAQNPYGDWVTKSPEGREVRHYTEEDAKRYLAENKLSGSPTLSPPGYTIHVLPITPELRKKAMSEGFSLFSAGVPIPVPDESGHEGYEKDKIVPGIRLVPVQGDPFSD